MPTLSFGEKLLIARKQLNLFQYEMAERLGVHPNSITKYERGEGRPQRTVERMFDLLCEQEGIRFDNYTAHEPQGAVMKIVLAEPLSPAALAVFAAEPGWQVRTHDQLPNGLPAELTDADALIVRSAVQADDALMAAGPKLRVIGRAGVGVDNIDTEAATRHGIVVMNTPGANAVAVAELAFAQMLALARKLPQANHSMHVGTWEKKKLQEGAALSEECESDSESDSSSRGGFKSGSVAVLRMIRRPARQTTRAQKSADRVCDGRRRAPGRSQGRGRAHRRSG